MTPEQQLLVDAESLLDEVDQAIENDSEINLQGKGCNASEVRPAVEYMVEMIREFVVAQTKPRKRS